MYGWKLIIRFGRNGILKRFDTWEEMIRFINFHPERRTITSIRIGRYRHGEEWKKPEPSKRQGV